MNSYQTYCSSTVRLNPSYSTCNPIRAGVLQGSDIAPLPYTIFTDDIPKTFYISLGTYADDTLIIASHQDSFVTSRRNQNHLNVVNLWANLWRIKTNKSKSTKVTFTMRN